MNTPPVEQGWGPRVPPHMERPVSVREALPAVGWGTPMPLQLHLVPPPRMAEFYHQRAPQSHALQKPKSQQGAECGSQA